MAAAPIGLPPLNTNPSGNNTPTAPANGGLAPIAANPGLGGGGVAANNPFAPIAANFPSGGGGLPQPANFPTPAAPIPGGPTQPGTPNPTQPGNIVPTTTTGLPATTQNNGINWNDGSNTITGDLSDTYGKGTGTAISKVLSNMGTVNDSAIQATIANTDLAAGKEYSNIQSNEAAAGVTANSSTAALASGDFYSGVNSQLQQTIGGMEVNEENTLLSTLTGEGAAHGPDGSTLDSVMTGVGDAAEIAGAVAMF